MRLDHLLSKENAGRHDSRSIVERLSVREEEMLIYRQIGTYGKLFSFECSSTQTWGCSSAGRAPALQAGGQEFDSPHLHHKEVIFFKLYLEN